jgi:hypothetical protein
MMSPNMKRLGLLVIAFILGTAAFGWVAVPAIGFLWGVIAAQAPRTPSRAGIAALVAWGLDLLMAGLLSPVFSFGAELAKSMTIPTWALWLAELVFPFALAWSAAAVGVALRNWIRAPMAPSPDLPQ